MIIESSIAIRQRYNEVIERCRSTGQPIFLTKNGKGDAVVMDIETYNRFLESVDLYMTVAASESEALENPKSVMSIKEAMAGLRKALDDADNL